MKDRDAKKVVKLFLDDRPLYDVIAERSKNSGAREKLAQNSAQNRLRTRNGAKFDSHNETHQSEFQKHPEASIDLSKINLNTPPPMQGTDFQEKRDLAKNIYAQPPPSLGVKYQTPQESQTTESGADSLYKVPPPSSTCVPLTEDVCRENKSNLRRPKQASLPKDANQAQDVSIVKETSIPRNETHLNSKEAKKFDSLVDKLKESNAVFKSQRLPKEGPEKMDSAQQPESMTSKKENNVKQRPVSETRREINSGSSEG